MPKRSIASIQCVRDETSASKSSARASELYRSSIICIPVEVLATMLSFLSLNQILRSASLCRHWYGAVDQSQPWSHIAIESSRYDLIADGFADWLCKVGTQTEIEELSLRISATKTIAEDIIWYNFRVSRNWCCGPNLRRKTLRIPSPICSVVYPPQDVFILNIWRSALV
jgi:hypothetical protein